MSTALLERTVPVTSAARYSINASSSIIPIYTVIIHKNEDSAGYWAECPMDNGAAFTDGDTVQETQLNMYASVSLYLQDDYPDITDFLLEFALAGE